MERRQLSSQQAKWKRKKFNQTLMNNINEHHRVEIEQSQREWTQIWKNLGQKFISSEIRSLCYILLHDAIMARQKLHQWKQLDNDLFPQCHKIDTALRRTVQCQNRHIWKEMKLRTTKIVTPEKQKLILNDRRMLSD